MNRRDFLSPGPLASAAAQVLADTTTPPECALLHLARRAMATTFELILPHGTPDALDVGREVFDLIDALEAQLTVYRDTSEVSRLNQLAAVVPVPVEEELFDLLERSATLTRETQGAFDVTAGALVKAWGFYKGPRKVPRPVERQQAMTKVGMRHVKLDREKRTVFFEQPGLEINLGSIGKGYALDRAARLLRRRGNLTAALLQGGHSSVYAMGSQPGEPRGWPVAVRHPWQPERLLATVYLKDRGLATSAATFQHLEHRGKKLGHILDPRTGWPAEGMASATVLAPTAAEADGLATAFYILGVEKARAYCEARPEVLAVLLADGEDARPVMVNLAAPV